MAWRLALVGAALAVIAAMTVLILPVHVAGTAADCGPAPTAARRYFNGDTRFSDDGDLELAIDQRCRSAARTRIAIASGVGAGALVLVAAAVWFRGVEHGSTRDGT